MWPRVLSPGDWKNTVGDRALCILCPYSLVCPFVTFVTFVCVCVSMGTCSSGKATVAMALEHAVTLSLCRTVPGHHGARTRQVGAAILR